MLSSRVNLFKRAPNKRHTTISVMYPETRGRISTDSTGSSRPVNSSHSFTSFSATVTTLTGKAGCCVTDAFLQPLPAKKTNKRPTLAKKKCFTYSDSHSLELI